MRANTWFAEASQGRFYLVLGEWNRPFLKQLGGFPSFKHDDKIDSVSGARHCIAPIRTWKNITFLAV
jgi:phage terminase large subunit-like protein